MRRTACSGRVIPVNNSRLINPDLIAIAGRVGLLLCLDDFDRLGSGLPCLVNIQRSGEHLMKDFVYAGGMATVLRDLGENGALNRDALTVDGHSIWENVAEALCLNRDVIHRFANPFKQNAGFTVLRDNLAPDGAVFKVSAASGRFRHARCVQACRWS